MPQFSMHTQIDIIMVAFSLHNYIWMNLIDDQMFTMLEQHLDYVPNDELVDIQDNFTSNESVSETYNEMKEIHNNIVGLFWDARQ